MVQESQTSTQTPMAAAEPRTKTWPSSAAQAQTSHHNFYGRQAGHIRPPVSHCPHLFRSVSPSTVISPPLSLSPTSPPCTHSPQWCPAAWCQGSWLISFHLGQKGGAMAVLSTFPPAPPNTKRRMTWSGAGAKRPILNASQTFQMPAHDFHYCQIAFASASC